MALLVITLMTRAAAQTLSGWLAASMRTKSDVLLDSESSKTSDFVRMEAGSQPDSVWAAARVIEVMADSAMVKLDHDPIPEWEWPQMTMMFSIADEVDIDALAAGQSLHVEINKASDSDFSITQIHIMEGMQGTHDGHQSMDHSSMDHSTMDHSTVDHSDHSSMDHSQHSTMPHDQHDMNNTVDHSSMDHSQHTMEASPMDSHQDQQSVDHSDHSTIDHSQHDQSGSKAVDQSKMHH